MVTVNVNIKPDKYSFPSDSAQQGKKGIPEYVARVELDFGEIEFEDKTQKTNFFDELNNYFLAKHLSSAQNQRKPEVDKGNRFSFKPRDKAKFIAYSNNPSDIVDVINKINDLSRRFFKRRSTFIPVKDTRNYNAYDRGFGAAGTMEIIGADEIKSLIELVISESKALYRITGDKIELDVKFGKLPGAFKLASHSVLTFPYRIVFETVKDERFLQKSYRVTGLENYFAESNRRTAHLLAEGEKDNLLLGDIIDNRIVIIASSLEAIEKFIKEAKTPRGRNIFDKAKFTSGGDELNLGDILKLSDHFAARLIAKSTEQEIKPLAVLGALEHHLQALIKKSPDGVGGKTGI